MKRSGSVHVDHVPGVRHLLFRCSSVDQELLQSFHLGQGSSRVLHEMALVRGLKFGTDVRVHVFDHMNNDVKVVLVLVHAAASNKAVVEVVLDGKSGSITVIVNVDLLHVLNGRGGLMEGIWAKSFEELSFKELIAGFQNVFVEGRIFLRVVEAGQHVTKLHVG